MRLFLMTVVAGFSALATVAQINAAQAVQDTPTNINGVEVVCTGVGSAKDDPRWAAYPVKIVLATTDARRTYLRYVALELADTASGRRLTNASEKEVAGLEKDVLYLESLIDRQKLEELKELVENLGIGIVRTSNVNLRATTPAILLGSGKTDYVTLTRMAVSS